NHPHIHWYQAVHPLLYLNLKKENRQVVPLDIALDNNKQRILVISGPNAGGKSVCLTTTGLIQYMFQCGLLVPVKPGSEMGIFRKLFINIGDDQSIENDLSTYSSHLVNMKNFIKDADEQSLILIDEFGAGTEPMLGGAIAEAILDRLNHKKVMGLITTHYSNLKHFASSSTGIENGAMLFDTDNMSPLYRLTIGEPGSSFAFEIAKKIGLPGNVLQKASSKVGSEHINFDKNLKDIIRDKRYWEKKRQSIREKEKKLEKTLNEYAHELSSARNMKKEVKKQAEQEAQAMLDEANKKIENTIRQIIESQADKEKTRQARKDFEHFKEQARQQEGDQQIEKKLASIEKQKKHLTDETAEQSPEKKSSSQAKPLSKGDKVRLKNRDAVGEVMDVNEKSLLVAFGNIITTIEKDQLERISEKEYHKEQRETGSGPSEQNFNLSRRRMDFHPELDIRGKRGDEALQMVRDFIDEAIMVNAGRVRILHGKGSGILRELVRNYLNSVDVVSHYRDEHVEYGGAGITVIEFDH
ncbi:MAG: Smr/MutS family protein, partial [Bacteroidales bacterium]|nr:Smr/MutS family protein [Bacteroidales bacterium]